VPLKQSWADAARDETPGKPVNPTGTEQENDHASGNQHECRVPERAA
jgi:hypothetical protein